MFGILVSAFNTALGWLIRGATIKFVILSAIYYVVTWIMDAIISALDISALTNLESNLNSAPASLLYFFGVFKLDVGLPMILGAMLTAFIIRRLPIIG